MTEYEVNTVGVHEGRTCNCGHAAIVESCVFGEEKERDLQFRVFCKNCRRQSAPTRSVIDTMRLWDQNRVLWEPVEGFAKPDPTNTSRNDFTSNGH